MDMNEEKIRKMRALLDAGFSVKCPHCGGAVDKNTEFCLNCGFPLGVYDSFKKCQRCGYTDYSGGHICPECGIPYLSTEKENNGSELDKKREAMLYYLFLSADDQEWDDKKLLFDKVCRELQLDELERNTVVEKCRSMSTQEIQNLVDSMDEVYIGSDSMPLKIMSIVESAINKAFENENARRTRIVWNMVNLGYADSHYSSEEKNFIDNFVEKWGIDNEIYQEMIDTCETVVALRNKKKWIVDYFMEGYERDEWERRLDIEINKMYSNIELTIQELNL